MFIPLNIANKFSYKNTNLFSLPEILHVPIEKLALGTIVPFGTILAYVPLYPTRNQAMRAANRTGFAKPGCNKQ